MPAEARQLEDRDRRGWLPIERVAELTGTTVSTWRHKAARLCTQRLAALLPPPSGKGKPVWWFSPRADRRIGYLAGQTADDRGVAALSGKHPAHLVERAAAKLQHLRAYWRACESIDKRGAAARVVDQATENGDTRISVRGLQRWDRLYRRGGVDGLVDRYGSAARTDGPTPRSPEAVDLFYQLYHTEQRLPIIQCHGVVTRQAHRRGWNWPSTVSATEKWLRAYDDLALTLLMRQGAEAFQHRAMGHIEQDYDAMAPGEMYVCDHHQYKAFLRYKGKAIRPWLTAVLDARTRVLVGYHFGPAPHSDAILQSLRRAFLDWGVPRTVKIDNGRDYTAKVFTGLTKSQVRRLRQKFGRDWKDRLRCERDRLNCTEAWFGLLPELGCDIVYAIPYSPWSKPVERWFRTLTDQHVRSLAAFCDTTADRKPEGLKDVLAKPDDLPGLDDERRALGEYLDVYHASPHFGDGMQGRSPRQVWAETPAVARVAEAGSLDLLLNVLGVYKVSRNGVTVTVGATRMSYGQHSAKLRGLFGREVLVAVDRDNVGEAVIMTAARDRREVICRVPANDRVSPAADATSQEYREAQAAINRSRKELRSAKASAGKRMKTASQIVAADLSRRARVLRATGTTGRPEPHPDRPIRIVQTGIDAASTAVRTPVERLPEPPDFDLSDLAADRDGPHRADDTDWDLADLASGPAATDQDDTEVIELGDLAAGRIEAGDGDASIEDLL